MNGVGPVVSFKGLMTTFLNPQDRKSSRKKRNRQIELQPSVTKLLFWKEKTWQEMKVVGEEKKKTMSQSKWAVIQRLGT